MSALPFEQAEEFEAMLAKRDLTSDQRRLLMLMHSAANGSPDAEIAGQYDVTHRPMYVMACSAGQERIAELCDFRTKTGAVDDRYVRTVCDELKAKGVLIRKTEPCPTGGSETQYYLSLSRLIELPTIDLTTAIGRAVAALADWDPFAEFPTGEPTGEPTGHDHEHEHDYKTHDHEHAHESMKHESFRKPVNKSQQLRMTNIQPDHVRQIVRTKDAKLFEAYFLDAVAARWAKDCVTDRIRLAALFHQVIRIGKARSPGRIICQSWKTRDSPDPRKQLKLAGEDEDFARQLLQPKPQGTRSFDVAPLRQSVSAMDD